MNIPESEIGYSALSVVDIGRVFWWQGRLFRAILDTSAGTVEKMFDIGLFAKLTADGLFVNSWVTPYKLDGYPLVVEHEVVPVPTYPREWSFSMLKDAAQLVLALNDSARKFGYQTKDCNGYNVLFSRGKPVFVDMGSFVEVNSQADVLLSYEEFLLSYYRPLQVWTSAGQYLGGRVAPRALGMLFAHEAYMRYRWPICRAIGDSKLIQASKSLSSLRTLRHNDLSMLRRRHSPWTMKLLYLMKTTGLFSGPARIRNLDRKIRRLEHLTGATTWANYHDEFNRGQTLTPTSRFTAVVDRLASLGIKSALEFAGNQGVLSRLLKRKLPNIQVICTDPDGSAIDKGYRAARDANEGIEWAIFNPFAYEGSPLEISPEKRFRADAVIALALTHHLTLSQNFRLEFVFDVISRYAVRYVFIEFMPLGLYNGASVPHVPDWYHEAWFKNEFCKNFELMERFQLEPNRILFIGSIASRRSALDESIIQLR
jgi:hypothetical protein